MVYGGILPWRWNIPKPDFNLKQMELTYETVRIDVDDLSLFCLILSVLQVTSTAEVHAE
jgi:hypothetical protein